MKSSAAAPFKRGASPTMTVFFLSVSMFKRNHHTAAPFLNIKYVELHTLFQKKHADPFSLWRPNVLLMPLLSSTHNRHFNATTPVCPHFTSATLQQPNSDATPYFPVSRVRLYQLFRREHTPLCLIKHTTGPYHYLLQYTHWPFSAHVYPTSTMLLCVRSPLENLTALSLY